MKYALIAFIIFLLLVIQTGVLSPLGINAGNLVMLFVITVTLASGFGEGLFAAISAGAMLDLTSGTRDGTLIICMLAVWGFTYISIHRFVSKEPGRLTMTALIAINSIIFVVSFIIFNRFLSVLNLDTASDWKYFLGLKLLKDIIVNLIFFYPIFAAYNFLSRKLSFAN